MAHKFLSGPFYLFQLIEANKQQKQQSIVPKKTSLRLVVTFHRVSGRDFLDWKIYGFLMNFGGKIIHGKVRKFQRGELLMC